jgi:hypothetical protein
MVPWSMCSWSSIHIKPIHWSLATITQTFTTASRCRAADGSGSRPCHFLWIFKLGDIGKRKSFISINSFKHSVCFCICLPQVWNHVDVCSSCSTVSNEDYVSEFLDIFWTNFNCLNKSLSNKYIAFL